MAEDKVQGEMPKDVVEETPSNSGEKPEIEGVAPEGQPTPQLEKLLQQIEELREKLHQANAEAAQRRIRLKQVEEERAREKQAWEQRLAELQAQLADLEAQYHQAQAELDSVRLKTAFMAAASKAGVIDPEAAYLLADFSGVVVQEDGTVEGLDEALQELKRTRPYLFSQKSKATDIGQKGSSAAASESNLQAIKRRFGIRV